MFRKRTSARKVKARAREQLVGDPLGLEHMCGDCHGDALVKLVDARHRARTFYKLWMGCPELGYLSLSHKVFAVDSCCGRRIDAASTFAKRSISGRG